MERDSPWILAVPVLSVVVINNNLVIPLWKRYLVGANSLVVGTNDGTSDNVKILLFQCPFADLFL